MAKDSWRIKVKASLARRHVVRCCLMLGQLVEAVAVAPCKAETVGA